MNWSFFDLFLSLYVLIACALVLTVPAKSLLKLNQKVLYTYFFFLFLIISVLKSYLDISFFDLSLTFSTSFNIFNSGFFDFFSLVFFILSWSALLFVFKNIEISKLKEDVYILLYFFVISSYLLIRVTDLSVLYLIIELQGLSAYVLAASSKNSTLSVEAGTKYFVTSSFSTILLLAGLALIYSATGTLSLVNLNLFFINNFETLPFLISGFAFIICGLYFKLGLFPFHFWIPDVYQGIPSQIVILFAVVPKLPLILLLLTIFSKFTYIIDYNLFFAFKHSNMFLALISLFVGVLGAYYQTNFFKLMAYSSIVNIIFMLLSLYQISFHGIYATLFYSVIYLFLTVSLFGVVFLFYKPLNQTTFYFVKDIKAVYMRSPILAYIIIFIAFSYAGIPPLAGFFSKLLILQVLISEGYFVTTLLAALFTTLAACYYIQFVKFLQFNKHLYFQEKLIFLESYFKSLFLVIFSFLNIFFVFFALLLHYILIFILQ